MAWIIGFCAIAVLIEPVASLIWGPFCPPGCPMEAHDDCFKP